MFISVIIPAYNEEKRIKKTLVDIDLYFQSKNFQYEILVVNDGSTDSTATVIENYSKLIPNLRLYTLEKNCGKGFAVKEGMRLTRGEYKVFMDADNSTSITNVDRFLPYFKDGYDIVISSRQKPDSTFMIKQPIQRRILGRIFRLITHTIVPLPVLDSQNGFKIFKREVANFLFSKQTILGWAFDVEILALAKKYRFQIKEVGIEWKNDKDSKLSLKGMVYMLVELFKIRINLSRKIYD